IKPMLSLFLEARHDVYESSINSRGYEIKGLDQVGVFGTRGVEGYRGRRRVLVEWVPAET
ncbi:hypothetical protein VNI00_019279, partial [Paramarasmius palmivorus]